jgi:hypothetical protein
MIELNDDRIGENIERHIRSIYGNTDTTMLRITIETHELVPFEDPMVIDGAGRAITNAVDNFREAQRLECHRRAIEEAGIPSKYFNSDNHKK